MAALLMEEEEEDLAKSSTDGLPLAHIK